MSLGLPFLGSTASHQTLQMTEANALYIPNYWDGRVMSRGSTFFSFFFLGSTAYRNEYSKWRSLMHYILQISEMTEIEIDWHSKSNRLYLSCSLCLSVSLSLCLSVSLSLCLSVSLSLSLSVSLSLCLSVSLSLSLPLSLSLSLTPSLSLSRKTHIVNTLSHSITLSLSSKNTHSYKQIFCLAAGLLENGRMCICLCARIDACMYHTYVRTNIRVYRALYLKLHT